MKLFIDREIEQECISIVADVAVRYEKIYNI
jgi:hypothetical protein